MAQTHELKVATERPSSYMEPLSHNEDVAMSMIPVLSYFISTVCKSS